MHCPASSRTGQREMDSRSFSDILHIYLFIFILKNCARLGVIFHHLLLKTVLLPAGFGVPCVDLPAGRKAPGANFQGWTSSEPGAPPQGAAPAAAQGHSFLPPPWTSPPCLRPERAAITH